MRHALECHVEISIYGVPLLAQWLMNLTSIHEDVGLILGLTLRVMDPVFP